MNDSKSQVLLLVSDDEGRSRNAMPDDVALWLDQHALHLHEVFRKRQESSLLRWPDPPEGWYRSYDTVRDTRSPAFGKVGYVRYSAADGRRIVPRGTEPTDPWLVDVPNGPGSYETVGPFGTFEEAFAYTKGGPETAWPPYPRLPADPRMSDCHATLEIAMAWRAKAIEFWTLLARFEADDPVVRQARRITVGGPDDRLPLRALNLKPRTLEILLEWDLRYKSAPWPKEKRPTTLGELVTFSDTDLLAIHGLGRLRLNELREALAKHGMTLSNTDRRQELRP